MFTWAMSRVPIPAKKDPLMLWQPKKCPNVGIREPVFSRVRRKLFFPTYKSHWPLPGKDA